MLCDKAAQWRTLTGVDEVVEGRQESHVESTAILEEKEVIPFSHRVPLYFRIRICVHVLFVVQHSPDVGFPKCRAEAMGSRGECDDVACGTTIVYVE